MKKFMLTIWRCGFSAEAGKHRAITTMVGYSMAVECSISEAMDLMTMFDQKDTIVKLEPNPMRP